MLINESEIVSTVLFTLCFLASLTMISMFTLYNMEISDYLQLVPGHTDCLTFSAITGLVSKTVVRFSIDQLY